MANSCNGCGLCCKLFLINLSKEEYLSGKYKTMFGEHDLPAKYGANFLSQKTDGSCIYLKGNECSIHADRPKVCRDFFCTTKAKRFVGIVKIIKNNDKQKISSVLQIKG